MDLGNGLGHLSYSTLVHAGDTWPEMRASLAEFLPRVKARVAPDRRFGVSLRLSAASVEELAARPSELDWLRRFLDERDLYVYTVNAFPYGPFKSGPVMERVYEPDWTTDERVAYTCAVADVLAEVAPVDVTPSIQTAPLAFAPNVAGQDTVTRFTTQLLRVVAHLASLEARTGRRVTLALEPEPACYLETTTETVEYFRSRIHSTAGVSEFAVLAGVPLSEATGLLRRHLGVVFDVGHQSVGFEDVTASLRSLVSVGIPVFKLQEAAALAVPELTTAEVPSLREFTETIYLSQSVLRQDGAARHFLTLREALDAFEADPRPAQLRTHFHVPVFLDELGPFRTTRAAVQEALHLHRAAPLSEHLEIETYTWDVLPAHLKTGDIVDYVSREIEFVETELTA